MPANKGRKRLIRQRAQRTGESYSSAFRHLAAQWDKQRAASDSAWRRIAKPEHGYAVRVPEDWEERPANLRDNPSETARFIHPDDRRHHVRVLRWAVSPGASAADIAEDVRAALEADGFGEFEQCEKVVAGRPAVQVDSVLRQGGRALVVRGHFIVEGDVGFCLSIATFIPEEDADLLRAIGQGFELLPTRPTEGSGEEATGQTNVPRSDRRLSRARVSPTGARSSPGPRGPRGQRVSARRWRRIEKAEYGYALRVPEAWQERPPNLKNSVWETARFVDPADYRHHCGVFRQPVRAPGAGAPEVAENAKAALEGEGIGEIEQQEISVAGRLGVELSFTLPDSAGWVVREHFVVEDDVVFCLAIGTTIPEEDAELVTAIAQGFELLARD